MTYNGVMGAGKGRSRRAQSIGSLLSRRQPVVVSSPEFEDSQDGFEGWPELSRKPPERNEVQKLFDSSASAKAWSREATDPLYEAMKGLRQEIDDITENLENIDGKLEYDEAKAKREVIADKWRAMNPA